MRNAITAALVVLCVFGVSADARQPHPPRSFEAKRHFWIQSGHPHGWRGHVVDHVIPLACGGADLPSNMQWQTTIEGHAKDRWERRDCAAW